MSVFVAVLPKTNDSKRLRVNAKHVENVNNKTQLLTRAMMITVGIAAITPPNTHFQSSDMEKPKVWSKQRSLSMFYCIQGFV